MPHAFRTRPRPSGGEARRRRLLRVREVAARAETARVRPVLRRQATQLQRDAAMAAQSMRESAARPTQLE